MTGMIKTFLSVAVAAVLTVAAAGYGQGKGQAGNSNNGAGSAQQMMAYDPAALLEDYPIVYLSDEQQQDMAFMYQEEKLARDVYALFYDLYGMTVFSNISKSEQRHMEAIKALLDRYQIPVPVVDEPGVFADANLDALYLNLIAQGSASLQEALSVGAAIERLDIEDLKEAIAVANEDAQVIYEKLEQGSEKHLQAFERQLARF